MYWTKYQSDLCLKRAAEQGWSSASYRNCATTFKPMTEPPRHGHGWNVAEQVHLLDQAKRGADISDLARFHGRTEEAIVQQLARLEEEERLEAVKERHEEAEERRNARLERTAELRESNKDFIAEDKALRGLPRAARRMARLGLVEKHMHVSLVGLHPTAILDLNYLLAKKLVSADTLIFNGEELTKVFSITRDGRLWLSKYTETFGG